MQQRLELKRHLAIIGDDERGVEALAVERHAVDQAKRVRPQLPGRLVEVLGREAKVELDARRGTLARRLAEELPPRIAREAVLGELLDRVPAVGAEDL
jgi:DNA-binding transcriptional regulator YdaS (Cro superfamily)